MKKNIFKLICVLICYVIAAESIFTAVSAAEENNLLQEAVQSLYENNIVLGDEYGNVMETDPITREQMACLIGRILGYSPKADNEYFDDRNDISDWAKEYVFAGAEAQYIHGYPDNTFRPKSKMTYEEAITFAVKAYGEYNSNGYNSGETFHTNFQYPDDFIEYAKNNGWLNGITVIRNQAMPRGDVITLLYNSSGTMLTASEDLGKTAENNFENEAEINIDKNVGTDNSSDDKTENMDTSPISISEARNIVIKNKQLDITETNDDNRPVLSEGKLSEFNGKKAYEYELTAEGNVVGKYYYILDDGSVEYSFQQ